jgi:hypothetical protein
MGVEKLADLAGVGLTAEAGDILTTPLLPELSISLADLFAMPA